LFEIVEDGGSHSHPFGIWLVDADGLSKMGWRFFVA
jgi:hypothetical protein